MSTSKPDLTRIWASGAPGANVVDPDTTSPGKVAAGWQAEVPPFEHFNFLQKWFTQGLAHFNEQGIAVWDTDTVYPINGISKGSNGIIYKSKLEQSGNDPVSDDGTNWISLIPGITYESVDSAISDATLVEGQEIRTTSFYGGWAASLGGPKGGAIYQVVTKAQHDIIRGYSTVDEYGDHTADNGLILLIISTREVDVLQFGATTDGVDSSPQFSAASKHAVLNGIGRVYVPSGAYKLTSTVDIGHIGGASKSRFGLLYGDGPGFTILDCELTSAEALSVCNWNILDMKLLGRGRTSGFNEIGISYLNDETVRDIALYNVELEGFDDTACRLSSAYNGIIELGRVTNCGKGYLFDNTGPWALGTTTWKLASVYIGTTDLGFSTQGTCNLIADLVTVEFCTTVADITGGRLYARRLYREGNTNGVTGTNILGYYDYDGSKVGAGDQDNVTFFSTNPETRGVGSELAAPSQDISTLRGDTLGVTYEETASTLFHKYRAVGSETGLRNKYPLATMKPFIELTGYVYANGTQYSGDSYGLSVSKVATGRYEILWNPVTFNNQQARVPIVQLTANENGESAAANPFNISYFNEVSTPGNFNANGSATGITVVTRQWNGTTFVDADCAFTFCVKIRLGGNASEIPYFNTFGRDATP